MIKGFFLPEPLFKFIISYALEPISYLMLSIALYFFSKKDHRAKIKILIAYSFIVSIILFKSTVIELSNNITTYNLLQLVTFFTIGIYYHQTILLKWKKRVIAGLCILDIFYYLINNIWLGNNSVFDSIGYVFLSVGVMMMIFLYLHQLLTNVTEEPLSQNFDFWFSASQMIYHLGAFAIFLSFNYLTKKILNSELYSRDNRAVLGWLWGAHNVLLFLSTLITIGGILWISSRKKSSSS
jgi:hypothetical protein